MGWLYVILLHLHWANYPKEGSIRLPTVTTRRESDQLAAKWVRGRQQNQEHVHRLSETPHHL